MNIFETLRTDHDRHRELLDRVAETEGDSPERRNLFAELRGDVVAHAAAEDRVFYSELLAHELTSSKSRHSVTEHKTCDDILDELHETDFSSTGWLTRFKTVAEKLRHHMEEEEREVFQLAGKVLTEEQKSELSTSFRSVKAELLSAP